MLWFVLASILLIEVCIVIVLLQIISLSPRAWLRWLIWLLAIIVSLAVFAAILSLIHSTLIHNKGNWPRGQNEFSIRAPFQTFRLLLILSAAGIPAFLLVFGIVGLLRVKDGTFRLLSFGVSWRSSVIALLIAVALMMASLLCNDRLVRQKIAALDDESRRLAMTVQPEDCDDLKNGAEFLRSLKASPNSLSRKGLPDPREDIELLRRHDWQDYFSRNRDIAQQAREASSHPCWRLDADWLQPDVLGDFPDEHILFDCINLLHFQGRQDLLAGNVEPALANAIALRRIAERLLYDPRVVAHVAATSAEKSAFSLIEHLLFLYRPSPDDVAKLVQPEFKFRNSLENYCVRQQGAHYHALAQRYFGLLASSEENKIPGFSVLHSAFLAKDRLFYALDDISELPNFFSKLKRRASLSYEELMAENGVKYYFFYPSGGADVTNMATSIHTLIAAHSLADMQRRLSDLALVLSQRGQIDEMLARGPDEVVPLADRPIDLFDGKPVRIIRADGGVVIYSVDIYGEDDGGTEGIPASVSGKGYLRDMTFCFGDAFKVRRLTPPKEEARGDDQE